MKAGNPLLPYVTIGLAIMFLLGVAMIFGGLTGFIMRLMT